MLIGRDDISNDVITIGACFHVFFNVCLRSCSSPLRADWRKFGSSVDGEPPGNWRRNSYSRNVAASSASFPAPPPARHGELVRRLLTLNLKGLCHTICYSF